MRTLFTGILFAGLLLGQGRPMPSPFVTAGSTAGGTCGALGGDLSGTCAAAVVNSVNGGKVITLAGNLTTTGAFNTTIAAVDSLTKTLPVGTVTLAPLQSPSFTTPNINAATASSLQPASDTTTAIRIFRADGSTVIATFDTNAAAGRLAIGKTGAPNFPLDITGTVQSTGGFLFNNTVAQLATNLNLNSAGGILFQNGTSIFSGAVDLGACRQGAGVLQVSSGTTCNNSTGTIRAVYQSSDGTAGATVTTCTGYKNGLCISGT